MEAGMGVRKDISRQFWVSARAKEGSLGLGLSFEIARQLMALDCWHAGVKMTKREEVWGNKPRVYLGPEIQRDK